MPFVHMNNLFDISFLLALVANVVRQCFLVLSFDCFGSKASLCYHSTLVC